MFINYFLRAKQFFFILMVKLYLPKLNYISTTYLLTRPIIAILSPSSVLSQARSITGRYRTIILYKQDILLRDITLLNLTFSDHILTISTASTSQSHTFTVKYRATVYTITENYIYISIFCTAHTRNITFCWNYFQFQKSVFDRGLSIL